MIFFINELYFIKNNKGYTPYVYKNGDNFITNALKRNKITTNQINDSQNPELCVEKIYNSNIQEEIEVVKYETARETAELQEKRSLSYLTRDIKAACDVTTTDLLEILTNTLNKQYKKELDQEFSK